MPLRIAIVTEFLSYLFIYVLGEKTCVYLDYTITRSDPDEVVVSLAGTGLDGFGTYRKSKLSKCLNLAIW